MSIFEKNQALAELFEQHKARLCEEEVLTEEEIRSAIEAGTMVRMARTQIAPAVEAYAADVAEAAASKKKVDAELPCSYETNLVKKLSALTDLIASASARLVSSSS